MRILFVCLGNICRSPTADAVFNKMVADAGLGDRVEVDSAGTGAWHAGGGADPRMKRAAARRGYDLTSIARQVTASDFTRFDRIIAMDRDNLGELRGQCPPSSAEKISLLRDWDPQPGDTDVPDPYYGGPSGFETVLDIVERACARLLEDVQSELT